MSLPDDNPPPRRAGSGAAAPRQLRPAQQRPEAAAPVQVRPVAGPAKPRRRHWGALLGLVALTVVPTAIAAFYLFGIAADQYASRVGFSVRKEEASSAVELLGAELGGISGSSSSDTDILYEYIQSQEMIEKVDAELDLRRIYSEPQWDPLFAFDPANSLEDLDDYWSRMVRINYDSGTGLIELRVLAFRPEDAQAIAQSIFQESSVLINELSSIAREDATRYASEELDRAVERLKQAREALTTFRSRTQIVDPSADIQSQMGLMSTLQQQLADALIEYDLLIQTNAREGDPRVEQALRRIDVIEARIADERAKLGTGAAPGTGENYATLFSEFERLSVDREFAEQAYVASLSTYDAALADAQRQSRYLAAYIKPTLAQSSQYPQRPLLVALTAFFGFLAWGLVMLVYYSIRDRR